MTQVCWGLQSTHRNRKREFSFAERGVFKLSVNSAMLDSEPLFPYFEL